MFDYDIEPDFEDGPEGEKQWRAWHEAFTAEVIRVAGNINAMEYYFIKLLSRYDKHECWAGDGVKSFAHWINWKCGINRLVAREKIRVARCLRVLPAIDEAIRTGRISYSKARALTRAATPDNETLLLEQALDLTTDHVEQLVRRYKKAPVPGDYAGEYADQHREPYMVCHEDEDGMFQLHARLRVEDGVLVEKAIEKMMNRTHQDAASQEGVNRADIVAPEVDTVDNLAMAEGVTETATKESGLQTKKVSAETSECRSGWHQFGRQRARALVRIAEHCLGCNEDDATTSLSGGDKYHVVVHVNANDAHRDCRINKGSCTYMEDGRFLAPHVASMLACDAARTTVVEDDQGNVLNIGRRSRVVSRAIELAVDIRDNYTCQYPNCHQKHHTDKHHIITWAQGGETSVKNLITLCRFHHVLQHEGKYHIERIDRDDGSYHFLFIDRHGEVIKCGMDPQFPGCDHDICPPPLPKSNVLNPKKKLTGLELKMERNRLALEFYRMGAGLEPRV